MDIEIFSKTTIVYESWMKMAEAAGGKQLQSEVVLALLRYAFYDEVPEYEIGSKEYLIFMNGLQMIEADRRKKNGGAPIGNANAKKKQPTETTSKTTSKQPTKTTQKTTYKQPKNNPKTNNDNGNVNDNVTVNTPPASPPLEGGGGQAGESEALRTASNQYPPEWDLE